jgi:hypothetical protein
MDGQCDQTSNRALSTLQSELRVAIRYKTTDVPGSPIDRAQRVVNEYATQYLQRRFSWNTDHIHCSSDFDSEDSKPVWIMCDFNITKQHDEVENIPIRVVQAHYSGKETAP